MSQTIGADLSAAEGVGRMAWCGYSNTVCLSNNDARVVVDPNVNGRVLDYSWRGTNVIMTDPKRHGWHYKPGAPEIDPDGGRFDIGPECVIPAHPALWLGAWEVAVSAPRCVRLTSVPDAATGMQLTRDFELAPTGSCLTIIQTMRNISKAVTTWCYWGRTFVIPGGVCVVPLNPRNRFPKGYVSYEGGGIRFNPGADPAIRVTRDFLEISAPLKNPKICADSMAGWMAYLAPNNLLFLKRYPVFPERAYNDIVATDVCVYYHSLFCEIEPIGPMETLRPGESASFTERWWLFPYPRPTGAELDLKALAAVVAAYGP